MYLGQEIDGPPAPVGNLCSYICRYTAYLVGYLKKGVLSAVGVATSDVMPNQACLEYIFGNGHFVSNFISTGLHFIHESILLWLETNIRQ